MRMKKLQIKLLEKQASEYYWSLDDDVRTADAFTEKFAELIVKECVDIVDREVPGMIGVVAMEKIYHHFDIEE
jgi:hypothetical protein